MKKREFVPVQLEAESGYAGKNLGPLPLVNPLLERMAIRGIVNRASEASRLWER